LQASEIQYCGFDKKEHLQNCKECGKTECFVDHFELLQLVYRLNGSFWPEADPAVTQPAAFALDCRGTA